MNMKPKSYLMKGVVRDPNSQNGLNNARIEVFDKDLFKDDTLGVTYSNHEGAYQIEFSRKDFHELFEGKPEIYVKVFDGQGTLIHQTKRNIRKWGKDEKEMTMNLEVTLTGGTNSSTATQWIGGFSVSKAAFSTLRPDHIWEWAKALKGLEAKPDALEKLRRLSPDLHTGFLSPGKECLEPYMYFLTESIVALGAQDSDLEKVHNVFSLPTGCTVRFYETLHFRIVYTTDPTCADAVSPSDSPAEEVRLYNTSSTLIGNTVAGNGVPTYIQRLGIWLEYGYQQLLKPPFSFKDPFRNGIKFKVEVMDLGGSFGMTNWREYRIILSNTLDEQQQAGTPLHELFHRVQYEYTPVSGSGISRSFAFEGTARAIEDMVNDNLNRYLGQGADAMNGNSLPYQSYESALFWRYLQEQYSVKVEPADEPAIGVEVIRSYWERSEMLKMANLGGIEQMLDSFDLHYWGKFNEFSFLEPGTQREIHHKESRFMNWLLANYLKDLDYPGKDPRFDYLEDNDAIQYTAYAGSTLGSPTLDFNDTLSSGGSISKDLRSYYLAGRYGEISIAPELNTVKVTLKTQDIEGYEASDAAVTLATIDDNEVREVYRFFLKEPGESLTKLLNVQKVDRILIVFASQDTTVPYTSWQTTVTFSDISPTPDVMITHWNTKTGREEQLNPKSYSWTWTSPDLWVDNEDDGIPGSPIQEDFANHLYARVRNLGTADAENVQVKFYYQPLAMNPQDDKWKPLQNQNGQDSSLSLSTLKPGESFTGYVDWFVPKGEGQFFTVKAVVASPLDISTDNKNAITHLMPISSNNAAGGELPITFSCWLPQGVNPTWPGLEIHAIPRSTPRISLLKSAYNRVMDGVPDQVHNSNSGNKVRAEFKIPFLLNQDVPTSRPGSEMFLPVQLANSNKIRKNAPQTVETELLPPGAINHQMVTIIALWNNQLLGGITYLVVD